MVTMCELPTRLVQEGIFEKVGNIKPGVYLSVDEILRSNCQKKLEGTLTTGFPSRGNWMPHQKR